MSNCIEPAGNNDCVLAREHFDYEKLAEIKDLDGNRVWFCPKDKVWILSMGFTCHREWKNFLWKHVVPTVRVANVRLKRPYRDEYDGFKDTIQAVIKFPPPGYVLPANAGYDEWSAIWR